MTCGSCFLLIVGIILLIGIVKVIKAVNRNYTKRKQWKKGGPYTALIPDDFRAENIPPNTFL